MESHSSLRRKISVATPRLPLPFLPLLLSTIPLLTSAASIANDRDRLGTHLTGIPLYRTPGNANVVKLGLGTPEQSGISLSVCESHWIACAALIAEAVLRAALWAESCDVSR